MNDKRCKTETKNKSQTHHSISNLWLCYTIKKLLILEGLFPPELEVPCAIKNGAHLMIQNNENSKLAGNLNLG